MRSAGKCSGILAEAEMVLLLFTHSTRLGAGTKAILAALRIFLGEAANRTLDVLLHRGPDIEITEELFLEGFGKVLGIGMTSGGSLSRF